MKHTLLLFIVASLTSCTEFSNLQQPFPKCEPIQSIPLPTEGMRWIVNEEFSDEFNTMELDKSKWLDYHPTWVGREPGLFMSKNIEFNDGCMVLRGEKMAKDTIVTTYGREIRFDTSCAAVVSKSTNAHYGYYECRFKANQTTLSSTFWFSSRKNFDTAGRQPQGAAQGTFSQELDVCECIGRSGDFSGKFFSEGMNSNVHYWFKPQGGEQQDIRIPETRLKREDGAIPSQGFNTYGVWWRDAQSASFYLNNGQQTDRTFTGRVQGGDSNEFDIDFKFTEPMGLNMVVETYPYPWISLPTDEELNDPKKNRTYYDWVRAYLLVDADHKNGGAKPMEMFSDQINILPVDGDQKSYSVHYTTPVDRAMKVIIYDSNRDRVSSQILDAPAGYANLAIVLGDDQQFNSEESYTAVAYIGDIDENLESTYLAGDSFEFIAK